MKFVLLSVVCLSVAVLAKPAHTKQKRDILPGDPRYGTDYHHNHHHAHHSHENEVEVLKAIGGYAGSYTVKEENTGAYQNTVNFQPPHSVYGPPNYKPGTPIYQPAPEVSQTQQVNHNQQQVQVPSHSHQQSSISNFKPSEHVETISNGYLSPVVEATQAPVATPAPYYPTAAPHYTTAAPQYRPQVNVHNDYLPPHQAPQQKTVQGPVTSYGTPAPDYAVPDAQPAVEHHDSHVVADVKSVASVDESVHVESVAPVQHEEVVQEAPVQHEEVIVQAAPVQQELHTYQAPVQQQVQTYQAPVEQQVQTYQAPVQQQQVQSYQREAPVQQQAQQTYHQEAAVQNHAYTQSHAQTQHSVHNVKTVQEHVSHVQPAVQRTSQPTQSVQRQVVHQQPATVQHQVIYQPAQLPQTFSNNYFGSGFDNFDTGFQSTYGAPNFNVAPAVIPQVYNTDFSNLGFGYQQDFQQSYQLPQQQVFRAPQVHVAPQIPQQSHVQIPSYTHHVQQSSVSKPTQLIGSNGGYVY